MHCLRTSVCIAKQVLRHGSVVEFALLGSPPFIRWPVRLPPFPTHTRRKGSVGFAVYRKNGLIPSYTSTFFFQSTFMFFIWLYLVCDGLILPFEFSCFAEVFRNNISMSLTNQATGDLEFEYGVAPIELRKTTTSLFFSPQAP